MFEQLNSGIDGNSVGNAHLHMVTKHFSGPIAEIVAETMKEYRIHIVDVSLSIHSVTHTQTLVPAFLACFTNIF